MIYTLDLTADGQVLVAIFELESFEIRCEFESMIKFQFKKGDGGFMDNDRAWLVVGSDRALNEQGQILLSGECLCYTEVEGAVNTLKRQLDKVLVRAKSEFKK